MKFLHGQIYDEFSSIPIFRQKNIYAAMLQMNENIRQARLAKGFSQEKMAELLGESRSTYAEWERNTEPKVSVFLKIAEILEINPHKLAGVDIEAKKDIVVDSVSSNSPDQVLLSFLREVEEEQSELASRIDVFLRDYEQRLSKSGTDVTKLKAEVLKLHDTLAKKGKGNRGTANRKKKP